ncbi:MAG: ribosome biogenesis factor YjgA [Gammaproteobacteria bacterium]|jgi:ribosome-associated protein
MHDDKEFLDRDHPPSKSQRKRDAQALQQLGTELLSIPASDWHLLGLPDRLISALEEAGRIRARGARKRQLQYIGKLMRDIDPEPIRRHFESLRLRRREQAHLHHQLEAWRDRLVEEGDSAAEAYLERHPLADRRRLRRLVRQARSEGDGNRGAGARRALFRYLRDLAETD